MTTSDNDNVPAPLDLEAIRARLEAATPGPWKEYKWEIHPVLDYGGNGNDCHAICTEFYGPQAMQNRMLVAHAPTDIALLVAEVERLRGENTARFSREEINTLINAHVSQLEDLTKDGDEGISSFHANAGIQALERFRNRITKVWENKLKNEG